ncbi:MAG TPA: hypothetical protein VGI74_13050 [Streptosporangiaceae bacterium]|jgi:hypothetical protein
MTLWTQDCLTGARRICQRAGLQLVAEGKHHSFGCDLAEQTWPTRCRGCKVAARD